jgi:tripartite-type tricarboxylate transporter receptor subunit TctC
VIAQRPLVALAALFLALAPSGAQEWPSGTIRVVLPYAPGGPVDFPARLVLDRLSAQTKVSFILDNRAGAGGAIGLMAVVHSPPDGGTLLFTTSSVTMVPTIYPKLGFDPLRDLTAISLITEVPISLAVRADHPARDLADLIARAKAAPGKYTFASGGAGTGNHMAGELLKAMAGIDMLHVPFRGIAPALTALYGGDIDIVFASASETITHVRDGRMRVLGVGTPQRVPELPDVPAIGEQVPGYVATNWYALFGPRGLPSPMVERLQVELQKVRDDPAVRDKAASVGMTMMMAAPDVLRARIMAEVPRWRALIPQLGLKTE